LAAGLDRVGNQPVVDELEPGDVAGGREGGVDRRFVSVRPVIAEVVRDIVVDEHGGRLGARGIDHRVQYLVLDVDQLGGVARAGVVLRDDDGNRIPHVAGLAHREHGMGRLLHRAAVLAVDQPAAGQAAHAGCGEILAGEHGDHPRAGQGGRRIDAGDAGMGVRRTYEAGPGLARQHDVVGVATGSGQEALVLAPGDALADRRVRHVGHLHLPLLVIPQAVTPAACWTALTMFW